MEDQSDLPASAIVSDSFSLKYSNTKVPYFAAVWPEPHYAEEGVVVPVFYFSF